MASSHGIPRVSGGPVEKSEQAREKERARVEQYKALEKDVQTRIKSQDFSNVTLQLTSGLLTQNPEYYSVWNYRRLILLDVFARERATVEESNSSNTDSGPTIDEADVAAAQKAGLTVAQQEIALLIKEDLQFLIPLLRSFPKCYWIWNHRAWLLAKATDDLPTQNALELWKGELGLVSKMLALDSRNFHGWSYRRKAVASIETLCGMSMAESEFEYTTRMIQTNLSNFSAWHNRSQLIPRLLTERQAGVEERRKFLDAEFELLTKALYTDPYDQSLWFYHQYLMSTLDARNVAAKPILEPCTDADRLAYFRQEIENVKDMLDGAEDCKYIYQALLAYSRKYLDLDSAEQEATTQTMQDWLGELRKIDPLREGRWKDLGSTLKT